MVSKVDYTVECRLYMLSKVDHNVDSCIIFQRIATVATSRLSIFFVFFLIDFSGKVAEFVQNGLEIFKSFR
jgi:hypothetical protein